MIIFNTTYHIEPELADQFRGWLDEQLAPQVAESAYVDSLQVMRVLNQPSPAVESFAVQVKAQSTAQAEAWQEQAEVLNAELTTRFGLGRILWFSTMMEVL